MHGEGAALPTRASGAAERTASDADVRRTFEQAPIALVGTMGSDHRIVAANGAYRRAVGRADLVGRTAREAFPEVAGQQIFEIMDRIYATGEPVVAEAWRYQLDIDGSGVTTDVYLDFSGGPLRDDQGHVVGTCFALEDATTRVVEQQRVDEQAARTRLRYAEALDEITRLQQALLPGDLPLLPGLDIAGSYLLAGSDTAAGGDWLDAVIRPDGRVVAAVGDVVGHGVMASAVMGQLRAVLRERLLSGAALSDALQALDAFARTIPAAHATTVCLVEIDPHVGSATYCTAGHPPPLVVSARSGSRYLEPTGSAPLATDAALGFALGEVDLDHDDVLLLYTDGILERPGVPSSRATVELGQVATDAAANRGLVRDASPRASERVCEVSLELLTRETGHTDDITLLALQRTPTITPLVIHLSAGPTALTGARLELGDWLGAIGARPGDELALQHALTELVTNAARHAYRDEPGAQGDSAAIVVDVELDATGTVVLVVRDHGTWRAPVSDGTGGRGLAMTTALVDDLAVVRSETGTAATVRHRLTRSVRILTGRASLGAVDPDSRPAEGPPYATRETASGLVVQGAVDLLSAGSLRTALLERTRGHSQPVHVDLDAVTLLSSVGVQVLHEAHAAGSVALHAGPGTPAQRVLELVCLPYTP